MPEDLGLESGGPDAVGALTTSQWWDAIAIRVNSSKAEGLAFKLNFIVADRDERLVVEMSNATLTNIVGYTAADADATITIDRAGLLPVMMQRVSLGDQIRAGKAKLEGDARMLAKLATTLAAFDPLFEIMPGTK